MDDLIKRQDAIQVVREYMTDNQITDGDWHADGIERELHELPSAVTYCKDCFLADLCTWRREGAEYCSYAERKNDGRFNKKTGCDQSSQRLWNLYTKNS